MTSEAPPIVGSLRDYLANQHLLRSLSNDALDVALVDELGLRYEASLRLSPCRQRLVLLDTTSITHAESAVAESSDVSVTRGDSWLVIPLNSRTTVSVQPDESGRPYQMALGTEEDDVRLVVERRPRTHMQPLVTVVQRLCRQAHATYSDPTADVMMSEPPPRPPPVSVAAASPPLVTPSNASASANASPSSPPPPPAVTVQDLCRSLQAKLDDVRSVRQQLLQTPNSVNSDRTPLERTPEKSAIVAVQFPSSSPMSPPQADVERLWQLERPCAPYSEGQSLGTIGVLGPASDDASAQRRYREIHGSDISSLTDAAESKTPDSEDV